MSKLTQVESKKYLTVYGHQANAVELQNGIANSHNWELRNEVFDPL